MSRLRLDAPADVPPAVHGGSIPRPCSAAAASRSSAEAHRLLDRPRRARAGLVRARMFTPWAPTISRRGSRQTRDDVIPLAVGRAFTAPVPVVARVDAPQPLGRACSRLVLRASARARPLALLDPDGAPRPSLPSRLHAYPRPPDGSGPRCARAISTVSISGLGLVVATQRLHVRDAPRDRVRRVPSYAADALLHLSSSRRASAQWR